PVGGDSWSDEGAKEAGSGAMTGAFIGGAIGLGAGIVGYIVFGEFIAMVAGLGLGAYVGSLVGALMKTHAGDPARATAEHPVERPSGHVVAIRCDRAGCEERALQILRRHGARDTSVVEGNWQAGDWKDFDPRIPAPARPGVPSHSVIRNVTNERHAGQH